MVHELHMTLQSIQSNLFILTDEKETEAQRRSWSCHTTSGNIAIGTKPQTGYFFLLTDAFIIFLINLFICLFIYFWLHWVFAAACGLSLVAVCGGYSSLRCAGFSLWWLVVAEHGL